MAEWSWGSDKKAVAITENDIKAVVGRIIEAVTNDRASDLLEQYKQFARLEIDLARARDDAARASSDSVALLERKDAEIAALRSHIQQLQSFLAATAPVAGAGFNNTGSQPWIPPIATTYPVPMYQDRFAASAPVPPSSYNYEQPPTGHYYSAPSPATPASDQAE